MRSVFGRRLVRAEIRTRDLVEKGPTQRQMRYPLGCRRTGLDVMIVGLLSDPQLEPLQDKDIATASTTATTAGHIRVFAFEAVLGYLASTIPEKKTESQVPMLGLLTWGDCCANLEYLLLGTPDVDTGSTSAFIHVYSTYTSIVHLYLNVCMLKYSLFCLNSCIILKQNIYNQVLSLISIFCTATDNRILNKIDYPFVLNLQRLLLQKPYQLCGIRLKPAQSANALPRSHSTYLHAANHQTSWSLVIDPPLSSLFDIFIYSFCIINL